MGWEVKRWIKAFSAVVRAAIVLLAVALAAVWVRSYWRLDAFSWVLPDGTTRAVVSFNGALHLIDAKGTRAPTRGVQHDSYRVPGDATHAAVHTMGEVEWKFFGFARVKATAFQFRGPPVVLAAPPTRPAIPKEMSLPFMPVTPSSQPAAIAMGGLTPFGRTTQRPLVPWLNAPPSDALIIPYWPLAGVACGYASIFVARRVRRIVRKRRGECEACGYDLRGAPATSKRCPECGRAPARSDADTNDAPRDAPHETVA